MELHLTSDTATSTKTTINNNTDNIFLSAMEKG
jgi:hypothetical protein